MKNKIIKLIFSFIISFSSILFVDAQGIYDNVKNGDIIIGNTAFRSGTWISATRAGKAGALFNQNTGSTNLKTYIYINKNLWYELNEETDEYKILNSSEISEIENNLRIYYINNNSIMNTYNTQKEIFNGKSITKISSKNVTFNDNYETITCPYGEKFEVTLQVGPAGDNKYEYYEAYCGLDDTFYFNNKDKGYYGLNILEIHKGGGTNNDDSVFEDVYNNLNENNNFEVQVSVLDNLKNASEGYTYGQGKFIGLNIEFDDNFDDNSDRLSYKNGGKYYHLYSNSNVNYTLYDYEDGSLYTLFLDLDSFDEEANFVITDDLGNYQTFTIKYELFNENNYVELNSEKIELYDLFNFDTYQSEHIYKPKKMDYTNKSFGHLYFDKYNKKLYYSNDLVSSNGLYVSYYDGTKINHLYYSNFLYNREIIAYVTDKENLVNTTLDSEDNNGSFKNFKEGNTFADNYLKRDSLYIYYFKSYENMDSSEKEEFDYLNNLDNVTLVDYTNYFNEN